MRGGGVHYVSCNGFYEDGYWFIMGPLNRWGMEAKLIERHHCTRNQFHTWSVVWLYQARDSLLRPSYLHVMPLDINYWHMIGLLGATERAPHRWDTTPNQLWGMRTLCEVVASTSVCVPHNALCLVHYWTMHFNKLDWLGKHNVLWNIWDALHKARIPQIT